MGFVFACALSGHYRIGQGLAFFQHFLFLLLLRNLTVHVKDDEEIGKSEGEFQLPSIRELHRVTQLEPGFTPGIPCLIFETR